MECKLIIAPLIFLFRRFLQLSSSLACTNAFKITEKLLDNLEIEKHWQFLKIIVIDKFYLKKKIDLIFCWSKCKAKEVENFAIIF